MKCTGCKVDKDIESFSRKSKFKYNTKCKLCAKVVRDKYLSKNRCEINNYAKKYRERNKDLVKSIQKKHKERYKEKIATSQKIYRDNNKDKIRDIKESYRLLNKEKISDYRKKYYLLKKDDILRKNREYNKKNSHIVAWRSILRSYLRRIGKSKEGKTIDILGYSATDLKNHIQSLFIENMDWSNHGLWHIDHVKPVTLFDRDELPSVVNALSNLQPLWAKDNLIKHNKF